MKQYPSIGKCLAIGIILLFIGVAIAPSINFNVVKASNENDLEDVTTQAGGIEPGGVKRGTVRIHFYEDLDNDSVFDSNEPSPPLFIVHLKTQDSNPGFMINRIKIIGCRGDAIFRFVSYPAVYNLSGHIEYSYEGIVTYFWIYDGRVNLSEELIGTQINLPLRHFMIPI